MDGPASEVCDGQPLIVARFRDLPKSEGSKLRTSTIDRMVAGGSLSLGARRAALEIERIYLSLTRTLHTRVSHYERIDCSRSVLEPAAIPPELREAYTELYLPWIDALRWMRPPPGQRPAPAYSIIINVVVFDERLDLIDRKFKRGCGFARRIVIDGLGLYADAAGWG